MVAVITIERTKKKMVLPDGGWGWAVVFGAGLTNIFNQSLLSIFGFVFGEKLAAMGESTVAATLVGNIMLLTGSLTGLLAGPLLKNYSVRNISMIGSFLAGLGMILSGFATTAWHFIITYSIMTGVGIGILQPATFMAVNAYFRRNRGRAVGISMAGTGLGQMLMPQIVSYLLDMYSFQGTVIILGALAFHGIVGSALFQPVHRHMIIEEVSSERQPLLSKETPIAKSYVLEDKAEISSSSENETESLMGDECSETESVKAPEKGIGLWEKIKNVFDLELLLDFTFLNIIFAFALGFTSNQIFNMLFPFFLQQEEELTREQTAMCMSTMAALDIVGRTIVPFFTDRYQVSARMSFLLGCIFLTIARVVLCAQNEYLGLLLASGLCGFFRSAIVINQNLTCAEYCGADDSKLPAAVGLVMMMKGIAVIPVGQLLGWVRDYSGSYKVCIYAQSALLVAVVILWVPEMLYKRYYNKEKEIS